VREDLSVVIPALVRRDTPPLGGTAAYVLALARELRRLGIRVTILGYGRSEGEGFRSILAREKALGRHLTAALWRRRGRWSFPPRTVIHLQRPEHVPAFSDGDWPLVLTFHGRHLRTLRLHWGPVAAWIYRMVERRAVRRARRLIFVSRRDREEVIREHPEARGKDAFIPVGVDREAFRPLDRREARRALGLPEEGIALGYAGRLEREKNVAALLEAVARRRGIQLWIAGTGRQEKLLRGQAGPGVRFLGRVEHSRMPLFLAACDALCLASRHEGLPTVVLEAWACGRPVLAPPVGDLPELLAPGGGVLARDASPEALAEAMGTLAARLPVPPEEAETLRRLSEPYGWPEVARRIAGIYREALAEGSGS
jgi:glycosyltransferase involved in cell wall biosynthesis